MTPPGIDLLAGWKTESWTYPVQTYIKKCSSTSSPRLESGVTLKAELYVPYSWEIFIVDETVDFFQSLVAFAKLKRQILLCQPEAKSPKDFTDSSLFWVNQEFAVM